MGKANEGIFAKLKKLKNLKKEGKKDLSYSNVPIDHPDVESIRKIDEKDSGLEYNEKEKQMEALGIESDKMYKSRRKAKRFVDLAQGNMARKRTATEGSFKHGGRVMPKEKPKDFYAGEGYKGSPDMYPDYEEDKKDIKKGKKPQHMGMKKGSLAGKQKKLDVNKDGKISGEDFKILRGKTNKMRGGGIAIKGTNFKGVY